jgi:hypothetical protein
MSMLKPISLMGGMPSLDDAGLQKVSTKIDKEDTEMPSLNDSGLSSHSSNKASKEKGGMPSLDNSFLKSQDTKKS